ncbi:hypothetical protein BDR04DRAFT_1102317 [Suillus decipiens]|nr:hypothetical protein BDR04DRAFT_1102317 [Suillus decipiens]
MITDLKKTSHDRRLKITVRWISGHDEVIGNELADREAKQAAKSRTESSPIVDNDSRRRNKRRSMSHQNAGQGSGANRPNMNAPLN